MNSRTVGWLVSIVHVKGDVFIFVTLLLWNELSVQLTLVVCSLLCYVVTLAEGRDLWNGSMTAAQKRQHIDGFGWSWGHAWEIAWKRRCFITVITLIESLTRLMNSLTRALGSQRVLVVWGLLPVSAAYGCTASFEWHTPPKQSGSWFCRHLNNKKL